MIRSAAQICRIGNITRNVRNRKTFITSSPSLTRKLIPSSSYSSLLRVTRTPLTQPPSRTPILSRGYASDSLPSHLMVGMPALSPTMTSGNIGRWLKKEGDKFGPGDILCEIETDKATVDFEAQEEGFIAKILAPDGAKEISVNSPIFISVSDKGDVEAFKNHKAGAKATASTTAPTASAPTPLKPSTPSPAVPAASSPTPVAGSSDRLKSSPLARKTAIDLGVSLIGVSPTGPGGRIIKNDVVAAAASSSSKPTPAVTTTVPYVPAGESYIDIPLTQIRKVIAQRLTESKQTIPHYYLSMECNITKLTQLRTSLNIDLAQSQPGIKLSVNDFVIKASALALRDVPTCNSHWMETSIRQFAAADICVAVSTDAGLMTPIVTNVESRGLVSIAKTVKELADKAKSNKLKPNEFQGGTFTVSNLGMFGITHFAAVINPPQSCILAVGGSVTRVIPNPDIDPKNPLENTQPYVTAPMMTVTLSADHRVVDGAVGAKFLQAFKLYIEDPEKMLL